MENSPPAAGPAPVDIVYDRDSIAIYRALDQELCRTVIELFDHDGSKWRGRIAGGDASATYEAHIKNSWDLEILDAGAWRDVFQRIHPRIQACVAHYLSRSPVLQSFDLQATGYKIQMYPKNAGYFRWHADSVGRNNGNRVVAMVLYLNDVATGGETEFFHQRIKISPQAGRLMLFPTGWSYMHCGHTPESSDKYIIQTFITIK